MCVHLCVCVCMCGNVHIYGVLYCVYLCLGARMRTAAYGSLFVCVCVCVCVCITAITAQRLKCKCK